MQFHDHITEVGALRRDHIKCRNMSRDALHGELIHHAAHADPRYSVLMANFMDYRWECDRRPYYNLWPAAAAILLKLSLARVLAEHLTPRLPVLVVRMPTTNNPFCSGDREVRTMICAPLVTHTTPLPKSIPELLHYLRTVPFFECGETRHSSGFSIAMLMTHPDEHQLPATIQRQLYFHTGETVQSVIDTAGNFNGDADEERLMAMCTQLYCFLMMLDEESELLERRVLANDQEKWDSSRDEKLVERAIRRGVNAWDIGRHLESIPHLRRPHFAIRWMGRGEPKIAKLRPIKGSLVHRDRITDVPTGYLDDEQTE